MPEQAPGLQITPMSAPIDFSHLTPEERLELIGDLWDSLDAAEPALLTPEVAAELDRRLVEAERDPEAGRPWEEIQKDLRKRLP